MKKVKREQIIGGIIGWVYVFVLSLISALVYVTRPLHLVPALVLASLLGVAFGALVCWSLGMQFDEVYTDDE